MIWWIDAACGVHPDTKIHSGGMMFLEKRSYRENKVNLN